MRGRVHFDPFAVLDDLLKNFGDDLLNPKKTSSEPIKVGLKFLITLGLLYVDRNIDRLYWNIVESVFSASKEVF